MPEDPVVSPITPTPAAPGARPNTPRPLSEADCPITPNVNPAAPVAVGEPLTAAIELPVPVIVLETPPVRATVVTVDAPTLPFAFTLPLASRSPPDLMVPVAVSLPAIFTAPPFWVTIESVTLALPPLLAKSGTNPVLQAVPEEHTISFSCSASGGAWADPASDAGAVMKAEAGVPPRVSASPAIKTPAGSPSVVAEPIVTE